MSDSRHEIEKLMFTYAELMDAGDLVAVAELFAHAELWNDKGEMVQGREAVLGRFKRGVRILPDGTPRTKHVTTNVIIDVDEAGDAAQARSYVMVLQEVEGEITLQPIFAGGYADEFQRVDGAWRFSKRTKLSHLIGDLSGHLNYAYER
jgi:3-phenylpropionate/cinnamic acid dioxygenase small subunit